jgi:hypothetical protein
VFVSRPEKNLESKAEMAFIFVMGVFIRFCVVIFRVFFLALHTFDSVVSIFKNLEIQKVLL